MRPWNVLLGRALVVAGWCATLAAAALIYPLIPTLWDRYFPRSGSSPHKVSNETIGFDGTSIVGHVVFSGLNHPWSIAFLPDGRSLVTERFGALRILSRDFQVVGPPLSGVPAVVLGGQGGMFDVAVHPAFERNHLIFWTYVADTPDGPTVAVAAGVLEDGALRTSAPIYVTKAAAAGKAHFGGRMVFVDDTTFFLALGDRHLDRPLDSDPAVSQKPAEQYGKILKVQLSDQLQDNGLPTVETVAIHSLGHRNIQGAAYDPSSKRLWIVEHGPQGGDELNLVVANGNYGWPVRSYGCPYGSLPGAECYANPRPHAPEFIEPVAVWGPRSIAPSGLCLLSSSAASAWRGSLLIGALAGHQIWRVAVDEKGQATKELVIPDAGRRIRDIRQSPTGDIYLLTDHDPGEIVRLDIR